MTLNSSYIISVLISVLCFIPAIVFHEVAHGFAAYLLGDPTAKRAGRLSLNPLKHVDIFGTVIMPLMLMLLNWPVFGYAKPVPYNPSYFKNPRVGDLIVGLAGPCANLILALLAAGLAWILPKDNFYLMLFLFQFASINLFLMFFNLLPIPPLDGSSIFAILIPRKWLPQYYKIEHYALPVFMILVLVVPYVLHFNPIGAYLNVTAGNLIKLIFPV